MKLTGSVQRSPPAATSDARTGTPTQSAAIARKYGAGRFRVNTTWSASGALTPMAALAALRSSSEARFGSIVFQCSQPLMM